MVLPLDRLQRDRIDANFRLATAAFIATARGGEVLENRTLTLTNCGAPVADYNVVFLKRTGRGLEMALERAEGYFAGRGLPFQVCVRADRSGECVERLAGRGYKPRPSVPGMQLAPIPELPRPPAALEIRRVDDAQTLSDFQQTAFEGFGLPAAAGAAFLTEDLVALPGTTLFVGYVDGARASTSGIVVSDGIGGIYWVATLERFRGRGYGEALTWHAALAARELGCRVASLQASDMGRPVYERMGFVNDRDYARYLAPER